ncbi:MAG TPA: radical SAM family heme chaperone HemW [Gemmatimonadales bacterium]|nr:radical SAM family heme chaperone HemW [Gemmatimonadales bacterium]
MHLYLHVPFCARRCSYCDFAIAVRSRVPSERYVDQVLREWDRWRGLAPWAGMAQLTTLYLGGGTPSSLDPEQLARLLARLTADKPLRAGAEVTLEANPDDITPDRARAWRAAGINRVSLGVQSFDPAVLRWMHRTHVAGQVAPAVAALRNAGIESISLDLIYALPAELQRDWSADLDQVLALFPDHLSLYGLTVEPHTPLGRWVDRGEVHTTPDERYAVEFLEAHARLTAAGYAHYEVSNYGRPGRIAQHNSAYWRRVPYLGLGPSAHSANGNRRWWNIREWAEWDAALADGKESVAGQEELSPESIQVEELYLGLRTSNGLAVNLLPPDLLRSWRNEGWAEESDGHVRLTPEGWLRLDALVASVTGDGGTGNGEKGTR